MGNRNTVARVPGEKETIVPEHSPDVNHHLFVRDERKRYAQMFRYQAFGTAIAYFPVGLIKSH